MARPKCNSFITVYDSTKSYHPRTLKGMERRFNKCDSPCWAEAMYHTKHGWVVKWRMEK